MVWLLSKHDDDTIKDIERNGDRAAAILAAACLEDRFTDFFRFIFEKGDYADNVANMMLKGYGPLGSFKSKIDLALLIGIIDANQHKTLVTIKEIRNEFAHSANVRTFKSQRINDLCSNLCCPPKTRRDFIKTSELTRDIMEKLIDKDPKIFHDVFIMASSRRTDTPRNRYMFAIKQLLVMIRLLEFVTTTRRRILVLTDNIADRTSDDLYFWPWSFLYKSSEQSRAAPQTLNPPRKKPSRQRKSSLA